MVNQQDGCIVCMEDLEPVPPPPPLHDAVGDALPESMPTPHPSPPLETQAIALIIPCKHVLHDICLREWCNTANSCPLCRVTFNLVQVLDKVGGTVLSEYEVENKKQVAVFDPSSWIVDEEEEDARPCPLCGSADEEEVLLLCDGCDAPYHTHCIGLSCVPEGRWFCMECEDRGFNATAAAVESEDQQVRRPSPSRNNPRTLASVRRAQRRVRNDNWAGAWNTFSNRIHDVAGLDLDFSDIDEDHLAGYRIQQRRTSDEQREFRQWQRRLNIASRQGARDVFRAAAPARLRNQSPQTPPESIEETEAWGAFEKAKEIDTATSPRNGRKRKSRSVTASPGEGSSRPQEPERKLKRPRTRMMRPEPVIASSSRPIGYQPPSPTSRILGNTNGEPSFLSSLLKEVEMAPASDDDRSGFSCTTVSAGPHRVTSPSLDYSSPASPSSSLYSTPRAMSITPPPHIIKRPGSPLSLTSRVEPIFPPADYSPNRSPPAEIRSDQKQQAPTELRQPRPRRRPAVLPRSKEVSPVRVELPRPEESSPIRATMSVEAKEAINKIVKTALAPYWKAAKLSKEQYANVNRDVSRKMYEMLADRNVDDEKEKLVCEKMATAEVATVLKSLKV